MSMRLEDGLLAGDSAHRRYVFDRQDQSLTRLGLYMTAESWVDVGGQPPGGQSVGHGGSGDVNNVLNGQVDLMLSV